MSQYLQDEELEWKQVDDLLESKNGEVGSQGKRVETGISGAKCVEIIYHRPFSLSA